MPGTRGRRRTSVTAGVGAGCLLAVFGAAITGGAALSLGEDGNLFGDLVMTLLFGIVPMGLGAYWVWRTLAAKRREQWEETERKVLTVAQQRGGVVSVIEVAADTDLSFDEVKRYLDRLADQGHVEVTPTDAGLAYRFPGVGGTTSARPPV